LFELCILFFNLIYKYKIINYILMTNHELRYLEQLGDRLFDNFVAEKKDRKVIYLYSLRPEDRENLDFVADYLVKRFSRASDIQEIPGVRVVPHPNFQFTVDLGHFLRERKLPCVIPRSPANGKEEYIPDVDDKRILGHIVYGSVVDHIRSGRVFLLIQPLSLNEFLGRVSIGDNYFSTRLGRKGLIKIEGVQLDETKRDMIWGLAPEATISLISEGRICRKYRASDRVYQ
jgi:hypothetical protein